MNFVTCAIIATASIIDGSLPLSFTNSLDEWNISDRSLVQLASEESQNRFCIILSNENKEGVVSVSHDIPISLFNKKGEYRLSFQARADRFPVEYRAYLGLMHEDSMPFTFGREIRQLGTNWQQVSIDIRDVNPNANAAKLVFELTRDGKIWIDELKIEELPPGTIGAEERSLRDLVEYRGNHQEVQITPDCRFLVNGKPFFPIGMWGIGFATDEDGKKLKEYGFNIVGSGHLVSVGIKRTKAYLDLLHTQSLMTIGVVRFNIQGKFPAVLEEVEKYKKRFIPILEVTKNHPALFAYDLGDETAWAGDNLSAFAAGAHFIRDIDPNHPIFSNQAPRGSVEQFRRWYRFVDVGGSDIYPWRNGLPDVHSDLPDKSLSVVGKETLKNLEAMGKCKPVIMTIQAFGWSDNAPDPDTQKLNFGYPPTNIQRFMAYDAIVNGASGVLFFQDQRYTVVDSRVKAVSLELAKFHDVLASPNETGSPAICEDKRIKILTKNHNGKLTIIAVNESRDEVDALIVFRKHNTWKSYFEKLLKAQDSWRIWTNGKRVEMMDNTFKITFAPWDVQIFTNEEQTPINTEAVEL